MTLADTILASHFSLVDIPDTIETIAIDGAEGVTSPNPHPVLSLMRWTTDDRSLAAEALDQIHGRFSAAARGFDWMTGPRCADADLVSLLGERGFIDPPLEVAAMVRSLSPGDDRLPEVQGGAQIKLASEDEENECARLMARAFDVPAAVGETFHQGYLLASEKQHSDLYALRLDNGALIGVGYLSYLQDKRSVLLRVSSVDEEHRGHGYYRALVRMRLADAARAGREQAFVHAYSPSSQKVLSELGFETVGQLQLHRWRP